MQRFIKTSGLVLALGLAALLAPASAVAQASARIWIDSSPDYFRRGDRMNVNFSVSDDSYVAVVHIDTDGNLDFVFPASPWDNEFVRRGVVHSVRPRGTTGAWTVRGRPGIGYFYIIASPTPLDFSYFRGGRTGTPWEWGYAGQVVRGDPFFALEQITRLLLPASLYPRYAYDYYSYYVDGIHQYPSYVCSNQYYEYGWGLYPGYGACSAQTYFLRDNPYYYDTRRYSGDRRQVLSRYGSVDPRYGFKADPDAPPRATPGGPQQPGLPGSGGQVPRRDPLPAAPPPSSAPGPAPAQGRAPAQGQTGQGRPAQPAGGATAPSTGARERPTPGGSGAQPAPAPNPRPSTGASGGGAGPARDRPTID